MQMIHTVDILVTDGEWSRAREKGYARPSEAQRAGVAQGAQSLAESSTRRVLLVERGKEPFKGKLVLPGGHIDPTDASPAHAAARELMEECGIALTPDQLTLLTTLDRSGRDPRGNYVSCVFHAVVTPEVLGSARAGSDAAAIVVRDVASLCPEELGFDHHEAIALLNARKEESPCA